MKRVKVGQPCLSNKPEEEWLVIVGDEVTADADVM